MLLLHQQIPDVVPFYEFEDDTWVLFSIFWFTVLCVANLKMVDDMWNDSNKRDLQKLFFHFQKYKSDKFCANR